MKKTVASTIALWSILLSLNNGVASFSVTMAAGKPKGNFDRPASSGPRFKRQDKNWMAKEANVKMPQDRNVNGYQRRAAGIKVKRGTKPPKWEKEGDLLYQDVRKEDFANVTAPATLKEAATMLKQLSDSFDEGSDAKETDNPTKIPPKLSQHANETVSKSSNPSQWGDLSVGPVLKQRLISASLMAPTPVQSAAFATLTNRTATSNINGNAIIASPTGSGKSLAFLLPLLANPKGGKRVRGMAMIATPTTALSYQLQREVDRLWPPHEESTGESLIYVVDDTIDRRDHLIELGDACILAGTPRSLRSLWEEIQAQSSRWYKKTRPVQSTKPKGDSQSFESLLADMSESFGSQLPATKPPPKDDTSSARDIALSIRANLQTIVLDEADRLLRTETRARSIFDSQDKAGAESKSAGRSKRKPAPPKKITQAEQFLSLLPVDKLRIICASATVGRTLRKQLMEIVDATSTEKAAGLITGTGDTRTGKNADKRKSSLLPQSLVNHFCLLPTREESEDEQSYVVDAFCKTIQKMPPAPTLLFTGKLEADALQHQLLKFGFDGACVLSSARSPTEAQSGSSWKDTTIYVATDRLGRGLDLPDVRYVAMLSPPSSTSEFVHLAGRTGRNGNTGHSIVFVPLKDVPQVMKFSSTLRVPIFPVEDLFSDQHGIGNDDDDDDEDEQQLSVAGEEVEVRSDSDEEFEWLNLSEASLKRKTISELTQYLQKYESTFDFEQKFKKADLVSAIQTLHG